MLLLTGLGIGNITALPEKITAPEPQRIEVPVEVEKEVKIEVPVRFEELRHKADSSLRKAFKMGDKATNADVVKQFTELAKTVKKLTNENGFLLTENKRVTDAYNSIVKRNDSRLTEVERYYQGKKLESSK